MISLTQEEVRLEVGIGASQVAAVCHLDPWTTAFSLWQQKTGRVSKPPQTPAMLYGIEMEPQAFEAYCKLTGTTDMQRQVAARHSSIEYLRAIADGLHEDRGVEIKCPSGGSLMAAMKRGSVPSHYLAQVAAEMAVFERDEWDFFVWKDGVSELLTVDWATDMFGGMKLGDWWESIALPAMERFWQAILSDAWTISGKVLVPEAVLSTWRGLMERRRQLMDYIESLEEQKTETESQIKAMVGTAATLTGADWKSGWRRYKPTFGAKLSFSDEQAAKRVMETLEALRQVEGVTKVEPDNRPESWRFWVSESKENSE